MGFSFIKSIWMKIYLIWVFQKLRKLRMDIKSGSWKWRTDSDFRNENERRYEDQNKGQLSVTCTKVKSVIKKTKDCFNKLIVGLVGGKPNGKVSYVVMKGIKMDLKSE